MTSPRVEVTTSISKPQLLDALRKMTVESQHFNPTEWSQGDAQTLLDIARMVRREVEMLNPQKGSAHDLRE